jgi:hypothetical protein
MPPTSDEEISHRLLGVWVTDPAADSPFVTTVTYRKDGTGTEIVSPRSEKESSGVRVVTAWTVRDGILTIKSTGSSDPARIPVGVELKDRIISLSEESFTFEAADGYGQTNGKRETRVRKKEPNQQPLQPTRPSGPRG